LIWLRTTASQMDRELERTTADITAQAAGRASIRPARHRHGHQVRRLPDALQRGYGRSGRGRQIKRLPEMSAGENLEKRKIDASQHFTEPPPRC
jgi:DNA topoisomerase-1